MPRPLSSPPVPDGPVPSPRQLAWHRMEFYGFVHFTMNTFTGLEWGYGDEHPATFHPTEFDARQIARTAREAGMQGLILTAKHHDGFCLWPSRHTEHSVRRSPWRGGAGDVVREVADACRAEGIRFGIYLSPWDRNHADYGRPEYLDYYRNQLRELLTEYGPLFMVWLDGANGGDGYYGGARERRSIDGRSYYDWPATWAMIRELCPEAVIFSDAGPDCRWVGNEQGIAGDPCWATLDMNQPGRYPGGGTKGLNSGERPGTQWLPAECDVSIRPGWFYHPAEDARVKSPGQLLEIYYASIGRGACLNLSLPPDTRGRVHERDVASLREFRRILDLTFAIDLAKGASVSGTRTRGGPDGPFDPGLVTDGNPETYWCAEDGATEAELVVELPAATRFNVVSIREYLPLGQRIEAFALDAWTGGGWSEFATGTSVGNRRLVRGPGVTTDRVRLRILRASACPTVREFALHAEPALLDTPTITRDWNGNVAIQAASASNAVHFTTDGSEPTRESTRYTTPFEFRLGGNVRARVFSATDAGAGDIASEVFGVCKARWVIHFASPSGPGPSAARYAIDQSEGTAWQAEAATTTSGQPPELVVDMGEMLELTGFTYLPPVDRAPQGVVDRYAFHASLDGREWGPPVGAGEFSNIRANPCEQWVRFAAPVTARYLRFVALHALDDSAPAVAELGVTVH